MRKQKKALLIFLIAAIAVVTAMAALSSQEKGKAVYVNGDGRIQPKGKLPVTDYNAPEPADPNSRAKRHEKSRRYNISNGVKFDPDNPINRGALQNNWELGLASNLPTAQSSAIIIGRATDAQAYLSEDKKNVYSEFTLQVETILKNDGKEPITVGDSVVAERQGGSVRFPSGRVETQQVAGQAPPQLGHRYLLFLGFNPYEAGTKDKAGPRGDMSRHILTGYELIEGKVLPLDTLGDFQEYEGKDEAIFLSEIRRLLAAVP